MTDTISPERVPVIVGVGELADHPADLADALEPIDLMADALRRAQADAGAPLLEAVDSLDIVNQISWPYPDTVALLCARLGIAPARAEYGPVGGQTPVRFLHEAALRIARGEATVAAVCGAEAEHSLRRAKREGATPDWSPRDEQHRPVRGADFQRRIAQALEANSPTNVYPFYELATRTAWGQSFAEAQAEAGAIWSRNAAVSAGRDAAWLGRAVDAGTIVTPTADNRLIAWPYTKLMVANPTVNQGAAVILTSLAHARALGVAPTKPVHIWGGGAADEPRDILDRASYAGSPAQEFALSAAKDVLAAGGRGAFDHVELYSCFPTVPKMARRTLGLGADRPLSVAGGLTFFGAPLNNYMTHAAVAMVEALRAQPGSAGLLYGQGEYVTKHHALVLSTAPAAAPLTAGYRADDAAIRGTPPPVDEAYRGPAAIETATVLFDRAGAPRHGIVIARAPDGRRTMARVAGDDAAGIARLTSETAAIVGTAGEIVDGADGIGVFRLA